MACIKNCLSLPSMLSAYLKCPYCNRDNFESARGLTQHQNRSKPCNIAMMESFGLTKKRRIIAHDCVPVTSTNTVKSHNTLHTGPIAADVQNMNSEQSDVESAQSDGWVMGQNSFSSEQSSELRWITGNWLYLGSPLQRTSVQRHRICSFYTLYEGWWGRSR